LIPKESGIFQGHKKQLLYAKETDTTITKVFTALPARVLRNRFVEEYTKSEVEYLEWPLQHAINEDTFNAQNKNIPDYYPLFSVQDLQMLKADQSAEEIIKEIIDKVEEQVRKSNNL
jgi:nitronate monooxygenase